MHGKNSISIIPPELLLKAYRSGIFPMSDSRDDPDVFWVEPRMRAILPLNGFHLSHSLRKTLRRDRFRVTCNAAFEHVIAACAEPRPDADESWISARIMASYCELHRLGFAHSIECWDEDRLVGGLYGVGFARVFCGESMFSRATDSSKVALAWLVAALKRGGAELLDCQFITGHLASLGAIEIPQADYLKLLRAAQRPLGVAEGVARAAPRASDAGLADGLVDTFGLSDAAGLGEAEGSVFGAGLLPAGFAALLADAAAGGPPSSPGNFIAQSLTQTS